MANGTQGGGIGGVAPAIIAPPQPPLAERSKVVREVLEETNAVTALEGLQQVVGMAQCAVRVMKEARRLERMRQGAEQAQSEEVWVFAAAYWKEKSSKSADNLEEYLVSSGCLKLAAVSGGPPVVAPS